LGAEIRSRASLVTQQARFRTITARAPATWTDCREPWSADLKGSPTVVTTPETSAPPCEVAAPRPPVYLSLFSSMPVVRVDGVELENVLRRVARRDAAPMEREGLRRRGREILAFRALHPEGATQEQVLLR
jgi:hypothetical protein